MTVVNAMELGRELSGAFVQVNKQIDAVKKEAEALSISPYAMRDTNGNWVLTPLLAAKASLLHALVLVNQRRN